MGTGKMQRRYLIPLLAAAYMACAPANGQMFSSENLIATTSDGVGIVYDNRYNRDTDRLPSNRTYCGIVRDQFVGENKDNRASVGFKEREISAYFVGDDGAGVYSLPALIASNNPQATQALADFQKAIAELNQNPDKLWQMPLTADYDRCNAPTSW